ncbi:MAG: hypothetical protein ACKV2T_03830 [Kofleriaceae bacterium]
MGTADDKPIDHKALDAALQLFVKAFVTDDKKKQMHDRLLAKDRRGETLEALPRWIGGRTEVLSGKDKSPAGIVARFGALAGVHLDAGGARRTSIARALELGRATATLWIGDNGRIALITVAGGAPLLVSI